MDRLKNTETLKVRPQGHAKIAMGSDEPRASCRGAERAEWARRGGWTPRWLAGFRTTAFKKKIE